MKHLLLALSLLSVPALAEDEPEEQESSQSPQGGQGAHVGGAGIGSGQKDTVATGFGRPLSGGGGGGGGARAGGASGPCQEEDLNWRPGKGGPATSVAGQAMRTQKADTTIAYRVPASVLGEQGSFGFYSDSNETSYMRLSNKKCEVQFKVSACEASYGSVTLSYASAGVMKTRLAVLGDKAPKDYASRVCTIPPPAGKIGGENYWWLNVHTKGPCPGGRAMHDGGRTPDGVCMRAILYESHHASGAQAGFGVASSGGGSSSAAQPPAAPKPNKCWKAPSGRTCCDVMFSPVPAECQRGG